MKFLIQAHRRPYAEDRFGLAVSRGYVRLVRHSGRPPASSPSDSPDWQSKTPGELDTERGAGRGDRRQSARSRNNMRRMFGSLPWELLGARPAMVSLTYPGDWRRWVPDGRALERHRRAFERRWVRRWREPLVGVWVKEFQESGRPHMHLYVGLPTQMSADDFEGLRRRTLMRHRFEAAVGRYKGRGLLPAISREYGGEFAMWIRTAWSEIVGTQGVNQRHHARGVDVAVMFWSEKVAATADRTKVAEYLVREASKWRQKRPPVGFVGVGQYFGRWGRTVGFNPVVDHVAQGGADGGTAGRMTLARPGKDRQVPQVVESDGADLRQPQAEEPETDDDLVAEPNDRPVVAGGYQLVERLLLG